MDAKWWGDGQAPEPMKRVELPSGHWQDLAADFMGPLPTGESARSGRLLQLILQGSNYVLNSNKESG